MSLHTFFVAPTGFGVGLTSTSLGLIRALERTGLKVQTISANDLSMLNDSFFETVDYIGAVSDQDTSSSWYKWVETALAAAAQD